MSANSPENQEGIRLAMLGMVEGNGHPYSWSAIFNGYDPDEMARCPFSAIPAYLDLEPKENFGVRGARVTHIWTEDLEAAKHVAKAARIPEVVAHPEEVIGKVDAVIVATDKGHEHVTRCRPFVEAGLPIFVDKPLVDNEEDLKTFCQWTRGGARILSSSCMRYCKEYMPYRASTHDMGELRCATIAMSKSWERYGIHALEGVYPIVGPGFLSVRNTGAFARNVLHYKHRSGTDIVTVVSEDMVGGFGVLTLCGTKGYAHAAISDYFYAFKMQLLAFVDYLRSGVRPFAFDETVELMKMLIAGLRSRQEGGREVNLVEIAAS